MLPASDLREVSVAEFIDAIEQNGLPQAYGKLFAYNLNSEGHTIIGGCAIGQAVINLGVSVACVAGLSTSIRNEALTKFGKYGGALVPNFQDHITQLNDGARMTLAEIAAKLRQDYKDYLDITYTDIKDTYNVAVPANA